MKKLLIGLLSLGSIAAYSGTFTYSHGNIYSISNNEVYHDYIHDDIPNSKELVQLPNSELAKEVFYLNDLIIVTESNKVFKATGYDENRKYVDISPTEEIVEVVLGEAQRIGSDNILWAKTVQGKLIKLEQYATKWSKIELSGAGRVILE